MKTKRRNAPGLLIALAVAAVTAQSENVADLPQSHYVVTQSGDDAEEGTNGQVDTTNNDLDLGQPSGFESAVAVGIRFDGVRIPKHGRIEAATIQFTKDEPGTKSDPARLTIRAELTGDAAVFDDEPKNISSRPLTRAAVQWSPGPWNPGDGRGKKQKTPDLSALIEEVVRHDDWDPGNALAFVVTGVGERDAISFDGGGEADGPMLHLRLE